MVSVLPRKQCTPKRAPNIRAEHKTQTLQNKNENKKVKINLLTLCCLLHVCLLQVAIKSATIIGSLLSAALHADLAFFAEEKFDPPILPRTAAQVRCETCCKMPLD